jgi:hypothetical protein
MDNNQASDKPEMDQDITELSHAEAFGGGSKMRTSPIYKDASEVEKPSYQVPLETSKPTRKVPIKPRVPKAAVRAQETEDVSNAEELFKENPLAENPFGGGSKMRNSPVYRDISELENPYHQISPVNPTPHRKAPSRPQPWKGFAKAQKAADPADGESAYEAFLRRKQEAGGGGSKEQSMRKTLPGLDTDIQPDGSETAAEAPAVVVSKTIRPGGSQGYDSSGIRITVEVKLCRCLENMNC